MHLVQPLRPRRSWIAGFRQIEGWLEHRTQERGSIGRLGAAEGHLERSQRAPLPAEVPTPKVGTYLLAAPSRVSSSEEPGFLDRG